MRKILVQVDDLDSVPQWVSEREPFQKNRYGLVKDVSKAKIFDSEIEAQRAMMEVSLYSWRDDWDRCS